MRSDIEIYNSLKQSNHKGEQSGVHCVRSRVVDCHYTLVGGTNADFYLYIGGNASIIGSSRIHGRGTHTRRQRAH